MECFDFLLNVAGKLLSFGQLPDNMPEIEFRGYMHDITNQRLVLTFSAHNHSAILSKIESKNYGLLKEPLVIDQKVSKGENIDVVLPFSTSFEELEEIDVRLYFQDMQNRRYLAEMRIYPQKNGCSQLKIRRSFAK